MLERISSYFDIEAIKKEHETYVSFLAQDKQAILDLYNSIKSYRGSDIKTITAETEKLNTTLSKLKKASEDLTKAQIAKAKATEAATKSLIAQEKLEQETIKTANLKAKVVSDASKQISKAAAQREKEANTEKKIVDDVANDYLQLSRAYNDAALKAKNYALRLGETHPVTIQAVQDAQEMYKILYRVDQAVGQNQRNVGNYKSAWDGLGFSFTQVARELPALAINFQTFALAISNNLPMAIDEIAKAKTEIKALQAEGKETPTLFQRITKSALSFQVGISLLITAFTLFSGKIIEFVGNLLSSEAAQEKAAKKLTELNKVYAESLRITRQLNKETKPTFGPVVNLEREIKYAQVQNKNKSEQLNLELQLAKTRAAEAQKNGRSREEEIKKSIDLRIAEGLLLDLKRQAAEADEDDLKQIEKKIESQQAQVDIAREQYTKLKEDNENYTKSFIDLKEKELEIEEYVSSERRKLTLFNAEARFTAEKETSENILNNDASTQTQRIKSLRNILKEELKVIEARRRAVITDPASSAGDISAANTTARNARIKAQADTNYKVFQVNEEYRKREIAAEIKIQEAKFAVQEGINERIISSENTSLEQKAQAQDRNLDIELQRELNRYKVAKDNAALNAKELEALEAEHQSNMTAIAMKATIERQKLIRDEQLKNARLLGVEIETRSINEQIAAYEKLYAKLKEGKISVREFAAEKEKIDKAFGTERINQQIDDLNRQIEIEKKAGYQTIDLENQIAKLKKQLRDTDLAEEEAYENKKLELKRQLKQKEIELAQETSELLFSLFASRFTR